VRGRQGRTEEDDEEGGRRRLAPLVGREGEEGEAWAASRRGAGGRGRGKVEASLFFVYFFAGRIANGNRKPTYIFGGPDPE
jgi:hypothetical protein